jgi:hypothetical protein
LLSVVLGPMLMRRKGAESPGPDDTIA